MAGAGPDGEQALALATAEASVEASVEASAGAGSVADGVVVTLIPTAASLPGCHEGGGQRLMLVTMGRPLPTWGMVTHTPAPLKHPTTHPIARGTSISGPGGRHRLEELGKQEVMYA